ncbi:T9SS type A sorting domain-containing protein [Flavobacterium sp. WV_118_3]|uniref:T9SS type A sorting domain-containing protein n=1 Tax=Flavobacterium sp. WV_118_3 TaxID=3151764 RepID=UPI0012CBE948|nr:T9SS type A sorting domain-containing protein [Flavobacterium sp.]
MKKNYSLTLLLFILINNFAAGQNCPAPSIVLPAASTSYSISLLSMSAGSETQWEIIILPNGSPAPTASSTGTITNSNPYTVTNLEQCTSYDFYVRAKCSESENSSWTPRLDVYTSIPLVLPIPDLSVCDTDNDGYATFDLTAHSNLILTGLDTSFYSVAYYKNSNVIGSEANLIPNPESYINTTPFQTSIIVKVYSTIERCVHYALLNVIALPTPEVELHDATLCFDPSTQSSVPHIFDSQLSDTDYDFEWSLGNNPIDGANGNTYSTTTPGVYSVTVTNSTTGCQSTATATLLPSSTLTATATTNNQTVTITVDNPGSFQYQLDNGPAQSSPIFQNVAVGNHTITIIPIQSACPPFSISTTVTLSDVDFTFEKLRFSPNPVTNSLTISNPEAFTGITISNLLGQIVFDRNVNTTLHEIDFSNLSKGIYLVRITVNNQNKTFKVIKE